MNKKLVLLSFACIAFLSGCGHQYQIRPLKHVKKAEAHFIEKKDNIELRVKKLTHQEVKDTFDGHYFSKYITFLLMTVKNNSRETIHINQNDISLTLLSTQDLESRVSKSILGRIVMGVLAIPLIIIPTAWAGQIFCACSSCCGARSILALIALTEFYVGIPLITGYSIGNAASFNALISYDLETKVISDLSVEPGEKQSRLLATKELQQPFTITLMGNAKRPTIFNVLLKDSANTLPNRAHTC